MSDKTGLARSYDRQFALDETKLRRMVDVVSEYAANWISKQR